MHMRCALLLSSWLSLCNITTKQILFFYYYNIICLCCPSTKKRYDDSEWVCDGGLEPPGWSVITSGDGLRNYYWRIDQQCFCVERREFVFEVELDWEALIIYYFLRCFSRRKPLVTSQSSSSSISQINEFPLLLLWTGRFKKNIWLSSIILIIVI